jgi:RHH-type proline utilization regulon transcriptional repressor/proline dehydrogenase/delta 1-pyrroline-5-carboxylate dehydrogenase
VPTLIEIDALGELQREVFGPIVHILRFDGDKLDHVIDAINDTGYGLTFGLHSRIDETVKRAVGRVRAGNLYINRNMVGAVVGVQPFGGEGKSGTGPKAGGPLYLHRLLGTENILPSSLGGERRSEKDDSLWAFKTLATWARDQGKRELAASCSHYSAITSVQHEVALPGPTGEINTLRFMPRGKILCLARAEGDLMEQIAAVLATDNEAVLEADPGNLLARLPPTLNSKIKLFDNATEQLAAILFKGSREARAELEIRVAAREGALLPIIAPAADSGRYSLYRLITERVVSINTTAAGGNTTLMTLGT